MKPGDPVLSDPEQQAFFNGDDDGPNMSVAPEEGPVEVDESDGAGGAGPTPSRVPSVGGSGSDDEAQKAYEKYVGLNAGPDPVGVGIGIGITLAIASSGAAAMYAQAYGTTGLTLVEGGLFAASETPVTLAPSAAVGIGGAVASTLEPKLADAAADALNATSKQAGSLIDDAIELFHGSAGDFSRIQSKGLDPSRTPTWVTTSERAAENAIGPGRVFSGSEGTDTGIIRSVVPRSSFEAQ